MEIEQQIIYDLSLSGLEPSDMRIRKTEMAEKAACGLPPTSEGYVIPYYNIAGKVLPFYRVKLFGLDIKYKQVKNTPNHVYFPPSFQQTLAASKSKYIVITEGEKKAVCACKRGFPTVALGGVDSWRNRVLLLPRDTEFGAHSYNKKLVGARLPSSAWEAEGVTLDPIAVGLEDLANFARDNQLTLIIVFDSDVTTSITGMKPEVQRAASELGFELRRRGIPVRRIRQTILPNIEQLDKTGLDDFLTVLDDGKERFTRILQETLSKRSAFPVHPNMEADLNKKLQSNKISRKDIQRLALSLITDLDARGIRMHSDEEMQLYYFEEKTTRLIKVDMVTSNERAQATPFSKLLYQYYGLSTSSDTRLMKWLLTQFSGEGPIENVSPYRVLARPGVNDDCIRLQINDGEYVKITGSKDKPIEVLHNGAENILFESGQVEPIDSQALLQEFKKRQKEPLEMWWEDVLHEVRLKNSGKTASLFALLYYISPWLHRWRGTQLPAELVIGEAGSGKSTLCELRLNVLTGRPNLRNAPADLKDWHASIVNTGGLHVTDNVQLLDKNLKQRLSDEICRLITEPEPHIEMRKYYTNVDLMRMKVDSVFAFTSIMQPFSNSDLLQRAMILELDKLAHMDAEGSSDDDKKKGQADSTSKRLALSYDSSWKQTQLDKFGGRTAWISHHLYVLHKFLQSANKNWQPHYRAKHRLINLEQSLILMGNLFKLDTSWIPDFLMRQADSSVVESDWGLEGLVAFCEDARAHLNSKQGIEDFARRIDADLAQARKMQFSAKDIANWAVQQDAYLDCANLINSRRLGRYLQTHKAMVAQVAALIEEGKHCNKLMYRVGPKPSSSPSRPG